MNWFERNWSGHMSFGPVTIYGFNAMHVAVNIATRRWGYICFHPTMYVFGCWWPWKFYVSPNATPGASTFAIGPGIDTETKQSAPDRRRRWGHNYPSDWYYNELRAATGVQSDV